MFNLPKTREEAENYRYGKWAAKPKGQPWTEMRCAYEVYISSTWHFRQCSRPPGWGPDGLYCKQHAKRVGGETPT